MSRVLELEQVEVVYEQRGRAPVRAVAGASLRVEPGQIVALVGESGCGKSTLARAAVGLVPVRSGSVHFNGHDVQPLGKRARARELVGLQMVFQNPFSSLNPRRTVGAQLVDAMVAAGVRRRVGQREVGSLLDRVGLTPAAADSYPHRFSGGQRQRIAVARALAARPSVIVLDEPLSSLDASAQAQLANLLITLARTEQIGLLLISHDLAIVRYAADSVSVMYLGEIVEEGRAEAMWREPLHPYTQALIAAIPHADGRGEMPEALPGEVPDPARPPSGCRFHPRCPYRFERCDREVPPLLALSDGRTAACWLHDADRSATAPQLKIKRPAATEEKPCRTS
jgi:oligopeptide/dipeptide ABC transporter ATP-binding protein